ncbi:hypothetical protein SO802_007395 [Lithocarpus litseifolius]|uniref:CSC1/OSCA1-like 7TM region domain-containing protein n=1 Tax=Lithocarpus litseifolius TaxID=425828 RepID=A0AAW2DR28_9ROSI
MNEEEINIMNSVMNKLFEREKVLDAAHSGNGQAKERDNSAKLISGLQFDENEADSETDEDNLIINVVKRKNNRMDLLGVQEKEQISENQDLSGKRTSKDGQNQNALKEQKRNTVPPNKKRKSLNQESDENGSLSAITRGKGKLKTHSDESAVLGAQLAEPESGIQQSAPVISWSQKSSWRALVGDKSNTSFSVSHILPGIASSKEQQPKFDGSSVTDSTVSKNDNLVRHGDHLESHSSETIKEFTETQPAKPSAASSNSGRGAAWLQKSSWTQLISKNNNSSFSLEQLLPGISYEKQVQAKPNSVHIVDSTNGEHSDLRKDDNSELPGNGSTILVTGKDIRSTPERHQQTVVGNNEAPAPIFERKHDSAAKLTSTRNVLIGETCSFMRSAASLKEWSKAKAALSGSLKRKSVNEDKTFHSFHFSLAICNIYCMIPKTIGVAIPMRATFFITYTMVDGWAGIAGEILMLKPLIMYHLKNFFLVKTEKDREEAMDPGSLGFNTGEPRIQFYFLLDLVYATVTPIILPFTIIFFGLAYVVFRHQIINVYNQEYQCAAAFWPDVHGRVISALVISQVLLIGLMSTKKAAQSTLFLIALPILTIWFNRFCKGRYEAAFVIYPLQEAMMKDTLERAKEPNLNLKGYLQNAYVHPVFKASEHEEDGEINDDRWENESVIVPTKRQS